MIAAETVQGCGVLGIAADTTREYSPEQNAKSEHFWADRTRKADRESQRGDLGRAGP